MVVGHESGNALLLTPSPRREKACLLCRRLGGADDAPKPTAPPPPPPRRGRAVVAADAAPPQHIHPEEPSRPLSHAPPPPPPRCRGLEAGCGPPLADKHGLQETELSEARCFPFEVRSDLTPAGTRKKCSREAARSGLSREGQRNWDRKTCVRRVNSCGILPTPTRYCLQAPACLVTPCE